MTKRSLADGTAGKLISAPVSVLIYGKDGIGKSSFPPEKTIFDDVEGSTKELDVKRTPLATRYAEVLENIDLLENEKHDYTSYAIDTLDWLEPMIWKHVLSIRQCNGDSIEDYGYGKGYTYAVDVWRSYLARLELLQRRTGMNVIMLAHGAIRTFENPEGENYDRYDLKLHKSVLGLVGEWPGAVLFATYESLVSKKKDDKKGKAVGDGTRVVYTQERPAFRAKNRYGLPFEMDLSWDTFWRHARGDLAETAEQVAARISEAYAGNDKIAKKVTELAGNLRKLRAFENHLQQKANVNGT